MRPGSLPSSTSSLSDDLPSFLWPSEYFNAIYDAAIKNDVGRLAIIQARGVINIRVDNETPVGRLAAEGDFRAVHQLLRYGASFSEALFCAAKANHTNWVFAILSHNNYNGLLIDPAKGGFVLAGNTDALNELHQHAGNASPSEYTIFAQAFMNQEEPLTTSVQPLINRRTTFFPKKKLFTILKGAVAGKHEQLIKALFVLFCFYTHPIRRELLEEAYSRKTAYIAQYHLSHIHIGNIDAARGYFFSGQLEKFLDCVGSSSELLQKACDSINYFLKRDNNPNEKEQAAILFQLLEKPEIKNLLSTMQANPSLTVQLALAKAHAPTSGEVAKLEAQQQRMETELGRPTKLFAQWYSNGQSRLAKMIALLQEGIAQDKLLKTRGIISSIIKIYPPLDDLQKHCEKFELKNDDDATLADFINQLNKFNIGHRLEPNTSRCIQFISRYVKQNSDELQPLSLVEDPISSQPDEKVPADGQNSHEQDSRQRSVLLEDKQQEDKQLKSSAARQSKSFCLKQFLFGRVNTRSGSLSLEEQLRQPLLAAENDTQQNSP